MMECDQPTITPTAIMYLRGIHSLNILGCRSIIVCANHYLAGSPGMPLKMRRFFEGIAARAP